MKKLLLLLSLCGCGSPATDECDVLTDITSIQLGNIPDGAAVYIPVDRNIFDLDYDSHLIITAYGRSSVIPTKFRLFRYGDKYDLYVEGKDALKNLNIPTRSDFTFRCFPITHIIYVDDIEQTDIDIALRREQKDGILIAQNKENEE